MRPQRRRGRRSELSVRVCPGFPEQETPARACGCFRERGGSLCTDSTAAVHRAPSRAGCTPHTHTHTERAGAKEPVACCLLLTRCLKCMQSCISTSPVPFSPPEHEYQSNQLPATACLSPDLEGSPMGLAQSSRVSLFRLPPTSVNQVSSHAPHLLPVP